MNLLQKSGKDIFLVRVRRVRQIPCIVIAHLDDGKVRPIWRNAEFVAALLYATVIFGPFFIKRNNRAELMKLARREEWQEVSSFHHSQEQKELGADSDEPLDASLLEQVDKTVDEARHSHRLPHELVVALLHAQVTRQDLTQSKIVSSVPLTQCRRPRQPKSHRVRTLCNVVGNIGGPHCDRCAQTVQFLRTCANLWSHGNEAFEARLEFFRRRLV